VVLGFKTNDDKYNESTDLYVDDYRLIGKIISQSIYYDLDDTETSVETLVELSHQIANKHNIPLESIKLYTGVRQC